MIEDFLTTFLVSLFGLGVTGAAYIAWSDHKAFDVMANYVLVALSAAFFLAVFLITAYITGQRMYEREIIEAGVMIPDHVRTMGGESLLWPAAVYFPLMSILIVLGLVGRLNKANRRTRQRRPQNREQNGDT